MYLEYMDGGSLLRTIKEYTGPMDEILIKKYTK